MLFDNITNYYLMSVLCAWLFSTILKMLLNAHANKKFSFSSGFQNGGMPSSHAALMGSITFALLLEQGFGAIFFLAFVITTLILRDAVTVRHEVGLIGEAVNKILKERGEKKLKVIYGHTLFQVIVGLIIGIISSTAFYLL